VVRFDSTVTVVDALHFTASLEDRLNVGDQVAAADVLALNKRDLVGEVRLRELRHRLQQFNPDAPAVTSCFGDLNPAMIFDVDDRLGPESGNSAPPSAADNRRPIHAHADDHLWSRTIHLPKILDRQAFIKAINSLPSLTFRVKGVIEFSGPRKKIFSNMLPAAGRSHPFLLRKSTIGFWLSSARVKSHTHSRRWKP